MQLICRPANNPLKGHYLRSLVFREPYAHNIPNFFSKFCLVLANLWEAYAIPLALSVVHRPSFIVCGVSSVSTITTRNNEAIKSIFSANVHHVPGLCLLGMGGTPYISHKIMARKQYFHIFDFFSETTSMWCFLLCQKIA